MTTLFRTTHRVEFHETDMAGIVHFSNFFRFMEVAEVEFLRSRGLSVGWLAGGERFGFPRVSATCDYKRPARFEDVLEVRVAIERIGPKSVSYSHEFWLEDVLIACGKITAVCCRKTAEGLEAVEIPAEIRAKLMAD
jgi:YbgC/YbaW family acyl-CoA thioester hydrolase